MGVPGPVTSAQSAGVHAMLREHFEARLVTSAAEVVEEAGAVGELADRPRAAEGVRDRLPRLLNDLLEEVPSSDQVTVTELAKTVGLSVVAVADMLAALLDQGLVEQRADGFRITALGRAPAATLLDV
jgi:DNA processing protein